MIINDETPMIICEFLVLLDERLRVIYHPLMPFGGKHIVLCSDFSQIETIFGSALCKGMHLPITEYEIKGRHFSELGIFHANKEVRAKCDKQKRCFEKFRCLPNFYSSSASWTVKERKKHNTIDDEIMSTLKRELSEDDY